MSSIAVNCVLAKALGNNHRRASLKIECEFVFFWMIEYISTYISIHHLGLHEIALHRVVSLECITRFDNKQRPTSQYQFIQAYIFMFE